MTLRLNVPMKEADKSVSVTHVLVWDGWFMTSVHFGLSSTSIKKSLFPSSSSALAWDLSTRKKWQRRCSIPSSLSFNALLITCMSTVCKVALVLSYLLSVVFFSVVNAMLFLQYPWSFRVWFYSLLPLCFSLFLLPPSFLCCCTFH